MTWMSMTEEKKPESREVIIRAAIVLTQGSVRLQVIPRENYESKEKGNDQGRWLEFRSQEAREAFSKAGLLRARKKFAIPAAMIAGSDIIFSLTIDWERRFRHREKLLASWVMSA
jgi:hypothetical protein